MNKKPKMTKSAFTLIVILTVISIIVILASILFGGGHPTPRKVLTEHRINNLRTAMEFYFPHIENFQRSATGAHNLSDYVQMLRRYDLFEEKADSLLLVSNGTWSPANILTASHLKDGFGRPIWIQVVNRETPNRPGAFYTVFIAIRSYGPNDDPDFSDDLVERYNTERLVWEKCRMIGYNGIEWVLEPKK